MSKQEEIKQALAEATPGPWIATDDAVRTSEGVWICQMYEGEPDCECDFNEFSNAERNAGFIAMAPEYIAYLLAQTEEYGTLIEQQGKEMIRLQQLANKQGKELEEARTFKFPRQEVTSGWHLRFGYLLKIQERVQQETEHTIELEEIEAVLLTLERVGPEGEGNQDV